MSYEQRFQTVVGCWYQQHWCIQQDKISARILYLQTLTVNCQPKDPYQLMTDMQSNATTKNEWKVYGSIKP